MSPWRQLEDRVWVFRDSCNVYAVRGCDGAWLVVNAGTGSAAGRLRALGEVREVTLLLTHHFRDHTAGAGKFRRAGAVVHAPSWERMHLSGEQRAVRSKQTYLCYDVAWDHFAPIESLPVDRWMMDYERLEIAGLPLEVIPTPGASIGASAYAVILPGGRKIVFVGEMMCSPGRLPRLSPLQYNYNDLMGAENVLLSWNRVLAANPDVAFPSMGQPITDCPAAVARLRENISRFDQVQPGIGARVNKLASSGVEEVMPRVYRARGSSAETHFIVGRSGRILALDYGYDTAGIRFPNRLDLWTRRTLLHSVEALQARTGAGRIDTVLPTHYHDDHVCGVPLLQRLFGTELWVGENFADLLERPEDFDRPCLWPHPMKVSRRLPLGQKFFWDDIAIALYPMSGHTEFSTLVCLEIDGRRVAHTGDQIFYLDGKTGLLTTPEKGGVFTNHVYRNGLTLGGYADCVRRLRDFDPEMVLSGHHVPYRPTIETWAKLQAAGQAFDDIHRAIMPLEDDAIHFGAESQPAKLQPYHLRLSAGPWRAPLHGWVLNPFNRPATARIRFATPPEGWSAAPMELQLQPREKRAFEAELTLAAGAREGRHAIALELEIDELSFGQVAEAWVAVGPDAAPYGMPPS